MPTITMQGIADLAGVRRPVVSVWRTRYVGTTYPFPDPVSEQPLKFDADEVARWLSANRRGNNRNVTAEFAVHSDVARQVAEQVDHASTLLLLHHVHGGPIADARRVLDALSESGVNAILDPGIVVAALGNRSLRNAVDQLATAAGNAAPVLDRLVDTFSAPEGPWVGEALTSIGQELVGTILTELCRQVAASIVPIGSGGLLLAKILTDRLRPAPPTVFSWESEPDTASDRAAWRLLATRGSVHSSELGPPGGSGVLRLLMWQSAPSADALCDRVNRHLQQSSDADLLAVVGPARWMTDLDGAARRRDLLSRSPSHGVASHMAPLRYVARLPKGLSKFGGRRRLALWVFGNPTLETTVSGEHSDAVTDASIAASIADDVVTAVSSAADIRQHVFRSSALAATDALVLLDWLTTRTDDNPSDDAKVVLARVRSHNAALHRHALLRGLDLVAGRRRPRSIAMQAAGSDWGIHIPGIRLSPDSLIEPAGGGLVVIGPDEIRDPASIGSRTIDWSDLSAVTSGVRLTEPGDVVYVSTGGRAAIVDRVGGRVVAAPARIFRCRAVEKDGHQLVPDVVAADIRVQEGSDRNTWRLRTVPVGQVAALADIAGRTERLQAQLRAELVTLAAIEGELFDGLATGALTTSQTR